MKLTQLAITGTMVLSSAIAWAREAPPDMRTFNRECPAVRLLPKLEQAYRGCRKHQPDACERFVSVFRELLPEYDCQRPFDATPSANYIVPAIWLAGDPALEKYVELTSKLKTKSGRKLFASPEFRAILDGHLAEVYRPLSENAARGVGFSRPPTALPLSSAEFSRWASG